MHQEQGARQGKRKQDSTWQSLRQEGLQIRHPGPEEGRHDRPERCEGLRGAAKDLDTAEEGIGICGERREELRLPPAVHAMLSHCPR